MEKLKNNCFLVTKTKLFFDWKISLLQLTEKRSSKTKKESSSVIVGEINFSELDKAEVFKDLKIYGFCGFSFRTT